MKTQSGSGEKNFERLFQVFERHKKLFLCFLLFALVWMAFAPSLNNDFVNYDDTEYVTGNGWVQKGLTWATVKWAFTTTSAANWHPLTWLSHELDCEIYGLKPWGHHLTSLLLHMSNTILFFLLLRKMTGAVWKSFFVAALFGLHPTRVESVAWVAERKDVLSALFWMLTLWAYARFVEELKSPAGKSKFFYALALIFFALGLMAKPMLVTLPCVLLLLDFWPLGRLVASTLRPLFVEKIPFFLLSAISCIITVIAQKNGSAIIAATRLPFGGRIENTVVSYVRYLGELFWPANLAAYYPHPIFWPLMTSFLALLLLVGITIFVFAMRRQTYLPVGWFWFLGTLVPVIGLVQVGIQSIADRYTYLPSIGIFIAVVWGIDAVVKWRPFFQTASIVAIIVVILACVGLTRRQIGFWADGEAVFRRVMAVTPDDFLTHYNLAIALNNKGQLDEAIQQFQMAIHLNPGEAAVHNSFGFTLDLAGRTNDALAQYQEALRLNPNFAEARANLGISLEKFGRFDQAIQQLQEALKIKPDLETAHYNLGNIFVRSGRLDDGIAQYQDAIQLNPNDVDAQNNLGVAYSRANRLDEATAQFLKAINLDPDNAATHNNLGTVLYRKGLLAEAIAEYQKALQLNPDYAEAKKNLDAAIKKQTELQSKY